MMVLQLDFMSQSDPGLVSADQRISWVKNFGFEKWIRIQDAKILNL